MSIEKPNKVSLSEDEIKAFAEITRRQTDLSARQAAVQEFLRTVVQSGEARMTELQITAKAVRDDLTKLWSGLKSKYNLDLDRINYDLSEDGKSVEPTAMRLK